MFAAPEQFAHSMPIGLAPPDYSYWRAVELTLRAPWYIVTLHVREGDAWFQRDLLVSWASDLLDVIQPTDRVDVAAIQLMQPVSGGKSWKSVSVNKVWTARHATDRGRVSPIFETSNGDRICDPMDGAPAAERSECELVWQQA